MAEEENRRSYRTRRITRLALLTAFAIVNLQLIYLLPILYLLAYLFASLPVAIAYHKGNLKEALLVYLLTSLIALFTVGFKYSIPFLLFFGVYPIVKVFVETLLSNRPSVSHKFLSILLKSLYFLLMILAMVSIMERIFQLRTWSWPATIVLFISLHIYDKCLELVLPRFQNL